MLVALTSQPSALARCSRCEALVHGRSRSFFMGVQQFTALVSSISWGSTVHRAAILGIAAVLAAGCKGEAAVQEKHVRPVKVAIVATGPQGRSLSYSGVVRPRIESAVGFRVAGKIVERLVNVGDNV